MLKYLSYLLKIREFCENSFGIKILQNLNDFPINLDDLSLQYYELVAEKIERIDLNLKCESDKFYIYSSKPFVVRGKIYYEISFVIAQDNTSKFNKIVAFSKFYIPNNYATKLYLHSANIKLSKSKIPVTIITKWNIDIRPCEMNNFCLFFGKLNINFTRTKKYEDLMQFLTQKEITLLEIVKLNNKEYKKIKLDFGVDKLQKLFLCLDEARCIIAENKPGKISLVIFCIQ